MGSCGGGTSRSSGLTHPHPCDRIALHIHPRSPAQPPLHAVVNLGLYFVRLHDHAHTLAHLHDCTSPPPQGTISGRTLARTHSPARVIELFITHTPSPSRTTARARTHRTTRPCLVSPQGSNADYVSLTYTTTRTPSLTRTTRPCLASTAGYKR
jgi:hypothetical protein